jgi:predicted permease
MTPSPGPRWARWLISLIASRDERDDVLADLGEEADAHAAAYGPASARRWYRRQVWRSIRPLAFRRVSSLSSFSLSSRGAIRDTMFALRSLRGSPVFAVGVVLMLAIGIGAHVVVYAVVDGLLLRPLPFGDRSARLVTLHATHPTQATDWDDSEISYPDMIDLRTRATTVDAIEGAIGRNLSVSTGADTERLLGASITPGVFSMLGVSPAAGRDFTATDAAEIGFESSVIVSHALWQSLLGGDARVVGRTLLINGRTLTIVGVMPPGFSFPDGQRIWLPYRPQPAPNGRERRSLLGIGLLRAGVTRQQATAELQAIARQLALEYPATNRDWGIHVMPIRDFFVSGVNATTILGAVTLVLLVACANVAGLLVARGSSRQRELSLRAALGAGRWRLVRLLLIEAAVLAIAGGTLGLIAASWGIRALIAWIPEPPPYWAQPEMDLRVAMFAIAMTGGVAMLSGLLPALRLSRTDAPGALLAGARAVTGTPGHRRLQRGLAAGQMAVSFTLLVGAGLLTRSATALLVADGGFDPARLLSLRFYIAGDRYDPPAARGAIVNDVVAKVAAIPGVRAVGATGSIPTDDGGAAVRIIPQGTEAEVNRQLGAQLVPISPTFWQAIDRPLISGRTFTATETTDPQARIVIVNQRLAARLWGDEPAIDRTLTLGDSAGPIALRVIGVAPDLVYEEFGEETPQSQLTVYVPPARAGWRTQALLISAPAEVTGLADAARRAIRSVDPGLAVYDVMTMADRRAFNHWSNAFLGRLSEAFAVAALLLACIGAYSIAAHTVIARTREIGVRLALGATRTSVTQQFLGTGARLVVAGGGIGAALAALMARTLDHNGDLFRTSPWTLDVWVLPSLVLLLSVLVASYLPARRASRIDPAVTLRAE